LGVKETPNVIPVVLDLELLFDQVRNSLGSPQVSLVSVGKGTSQEMLNEQGLLFVRQAGGSTGRRLGFQRRLATRQKCVAPAHH